MFLSYSRLKPRDSGVRLKASQHIWSLLCDKVKPVSHLGDDLGILGVVTSAKFEIV